MSCLHFGISPASAEYHTKEQSKTRPKPDSIFVYFHKYRKFVRRQDHDVEIVLSVRGGSLTSLNFQRNIHSVLHTSRILRSHRCFLYAEKKLCSICGVVSIAITFKYLCRRNRNGVTLGIRMILMMELFLEIECQSSKLSNFWISI